MLKIANKNIEKCRRKAKKGPILSYRDIGHFFDFILHVSIFLLDIFGIASQLSCEAMFKMSIKNIKNVGENRRKDQF